MRRVALAIVVGSVLLSACTGGTTPTSTGSAGGSVDKSPASGSAACPESPLPVAIYHARIRPSDVTRVHEYFPVLADFMVGEWTEGVGVADPNCYYTNWYVLRKDGQVAFVDAHPFTVTAPGEITLHGAGECAGTYRIVPRGNEFEWRLVAECPTGRPEVHTAATWVLESS